MRLLRIKARVVQKTPLGMKQEAMHQDEENPEDAFWVLRETAVLAVEVYRIIKYDERFTVVEMFGEDRYLVEEPFEEVYAKWEGIPEIPEEPATDDLD
jgi:hypothetical protein